MELSKRKIISTSWTLTKKNMSILIMITASYLFIISALFYTFSIMSPDLAEQIISKDITHALTLPKLSLQQTLFIISATLFITGLILGFTQICLNIFNSEAVDLKQLFSSFHMLAPYIIVTFFYTAAHIVIAAPGIIILFFIIKSNINGAFYYIGILLTIVPIYYLSLRLQFYIYFLIDTDCDLIESIKRSAHISRGYVYTLLILGLILSIIIQISLIPYFLGLIISIPYVKMANTYIYMQLKENN